MQFSLLTPSGATVRYHNPTGLYPVNEHQSVLLARAAMEQAHMLATQKRWLTFHSALTSLSAIELCAGNGPAAVALKTMGVGHIVALDINPAALKAAEANAALNGVKLDSLLVKDITSPDFAQKNLSGFDLLVCNPPCAPTDTVALGVKNDVKRAADGGASGTDILLRLIKVARRMLTAKGRMVIMVTSGSDVAAVVNALDESFSHSWFASPGTPIAAPIPPTPGNEKYELEDRGQKLLKFNGSERMLVWDGGGCVFRLTWALIACNEPPQEQKAWTLDKRLPLCPYGWPLSPLPPAYEAASKRFKAHLASVCTG